MNLERELKLAFRPGDRRRIGRLAVIRQFAGGPAAHARLLTVYYDTADAALARRGIMLRLRRAGGRWVQSVKTSGASRGGLHRRKEYEWPVDGRAIRPDRWRRIPALRAALADLADMPVRPVFDTRFRRSTWRLRLPGGAEVDLARDVGEVRAGGRRARICELELELKAGPLRALRRLAREIAAELDVRPDDISKAHRGYRLLRAGRIRAKTPATSDTA